MRHERFFGGKRRLREEAVTGLGADRAAGAVPHVSCGSGETRGGSAADGAGGSGTCTLAVCFSWLSGRRGVFGAGARDMAFLDEGKAGVRGRWDLHRTARL